MKIVDPPGDQASQIYPREAHPFNILTHSTQRAASVQSVTSTRIAIAACEPPPGFHKGLQPRHLPAYPCPNIPAAPPLRPRSQEAKLQAPMHAGRPVGVGQVEGRLGSRRAVGGGGNGVSGLVGLEGERLAYAGGFGDAPMGDGVRRPRIEMRGACLGDPGPFWAAAAMLCWPGPGPSMTLEV